VPGTVYSNADVLNMSFVSHELTVGSNYAWQYSTGSSDATGALTITSSTRPAGTTIPGAIGVTISVERQRCRHHDRRNGYVPRIPFGRQKDDRRTYTDSTHPNEYKLMIIQITGKTYTAGPLPAGSSATHYLACGAAPAPFWLHYTTTVVSGGVMNFSNWMSNAEITISPARTGSITSSGAISVAEIPSCHGQVSDDGKITVATQTSGNSPNLFYRLV